MGCSSSCSQADAPRERAFDVVQVSCESIKPARTNSNSTLNSEGSSGWTKNCGYKSEEETASTVSTAFDSLQSSFESSDEIGVPSAFDSSELLLWDKTRFKPIQRLADANRNQGAVHLMYDQRTGEQVAVKEMPNAWICKSHEEFKRKHPNQGEDPWKDIGYTQFLNSMNYRYASRLHGVYQSCSHTFVASSYAQGGDLYSFAYGGCNLAPGPEREKNLAPLVMQIFTAVKQLHDVNVVHRDLSLENVLLTGQTFRELQIQIIDFGMASTERTSQNAVRGKASYQAPEMHNAKEYDSFLADDFSAGVIAYSLLMKDYPWMATKPGGCRNFRFVQKHGFRAYFEQRKVRENKDVAIAKVISPELLQLIEGLLSFDPDRRLTLGEKAFDDRRSVWDEPWTKQWLGSA